jgi:two-component system, NtrC family, response regulator AtoC
MRLLLLGPDSSLQESLAKALGDAGYSAEHRRDLDAALVEALASAPEALLLDLEAGDSTVLDFLRRYRAGGGAGVVVVTGAANSRLSSAALREGADAFVRNPPVADELLWTLHQAEERERLRQEVARLRATLGARGLEPLVVAEDPKMRTLLELAARAAAADGAVLITGERGTGKALLAQAMHRFSRRGDGAFVAVDCDAAPDLFSPANGSNGHDTDLIAISGDPQALWRSASRGTLLLEEVLALSPESQAQLVSRYWPRSNGNGSPADSAEADVRVMATSCTPVDRAVGEGRFRPELLQRLKGAIIALPPLRERPEDIPALVTHFAQQVASRTGRPISITPQALAGLSAYVWPGNVRELRQVVERAATLSPTGRLDRADFPTIAVDRSVAFGPGGFALKPQVEAVEREAIARALAEAQGTRREAARLLQVSLRTLFYKLRRYGLA